MDAEEIKKRTKKFAVDIGKLTLQLDEELLKIIVATINSSRRT